MTEQTPQITDIQAMEQLQAICDALGLRVFQMFVKIVIERKQDIISRELEAETREQFKRASALIAARPLA